MVWPWKVLGKGVEGPHLGVGTVTSRGIVTFPFGTIQHSVQPRHLMTHFTATCRIRLIVLDLRRLQADEVQL